MTAVGKLEQALQDTGMSAEESKLYLAVMSLGMAHIADIARAAGIRRTTAYAHMEQLLRQDYVRKTIKGKRTYYYAEAPERIMRAFRARMNKAEAIFPELAALYEQSERRPSVRFYEGKQGLRAAYRELTTTSQELLSVFSADRYFELFSEKDGQEFFDNLRKQGGRLRDLVENSPAGRVYVRNKFAKDVGTSKLLPKGFVVGTDLLVTDERVAMISFDNLVAVIIENRTIAQVHKQLLQYVWKH